MFKNKAVASLKHFTISAIVALFTLFLVYWVWYPGALSKAMGVNKIFWMILAIDVILGPLLTFVVFKKGKKSLKFDLTVIVLLQLIAYVYGLNTVFSGRPAWLVFSVDRFEAVAAHDIEDTYRTNTDETLNQLSITGPKWVATQMPNDPEKKSDLMFEVLSGGADIHLRPNLYKHIHDATNIKERMKPLDQLSQFNPTLTHPDDLNQWPSAVGFLPLSGKFEDMTVLLNEEGEVIEIIDFRPW